MRSIRIRLFLATVAWLWVSLWVWVWLPASAEASSLLMSRVDLPRGTFDSLAGALVLGGLVLGVRRSRSGSIARRGRVDST